MHYTSKYFEVAKLVVCYGEADNYLDRKVGTRRAKAFRVRARMKARADLIGSLSSFVIAAGRTTGALTVQLI